MKIRNDHYVRWRDYPSINTIAKELRVRAGLSDCWSFSVTDFIIKFLKPQLNEIEAFEIKLFNMRQNESPARVTYNPLILWVNIKTWKHAELGYSYAKYILAHEIGHIILHNHDAKAFSDDPRSWIKSSKNERSAEWQANTFADCFLVSDNALSQLDGIDSVATACKVSKVMAGRRIAAFGHNEEGNAFYQENEHLNAGGCIHCGNHSVELNGKVFRCQTCGSYMDAADIWQEPAV